MSTSQDSFTLIRSELRRLLTSARDVYAPLFAWLDTPGGIAVTVFNVDDPIPPAVMERVKKVPHVLDAKLIRL